MKLFFYLCCLLGVAAISCEDNADDSPLPVADSLSLYDAFPLLQFERPVDLQNAGDGKLYVVEQPGVIRLVENNQAASEKAIFLDIRDRVNDRNNEQGLLGLAFHPEYNANGLFFVNYTTEQNTTRISRFQTDPGDPQKVLTNSELIILEFDQPFSNHNGGQLAFGGDNYLYIAVGDGGSAGDPQNHGQNLNSLLGKILRIDVNSSQNNSNYSIPADNPFFDNAQNHRQEIYAYGLRNPWRFSFDAQSGLLWAADVGQGDYEEIDIIEKGGNYGWNILEGPECFAVAQCDGSLFEAPYFHYSHQNGDLSITGGYVYRGAIAALSGHYIYADYVSGRIWGLPVSSSPPASVLLFDTEYNISSFGVDHLGELYLCDLNGKIFKIGL